MKLTSRFLVVFAVLLGVRSPYIGTSIGESVLKKQTDFIQDNRSKI